MIHVHATIQLAPGTRAAFLNRFRELLPTVRAESGCMEYGPAIDMPNPVSQLPIREDCVTVIEKWADMQSLQNHLSAAHMARFRQTVKDLVMGIEIRVLDPA